MIWLDPPALNILQSTVYWMLAGTQRVDLGVLGRLGDGVGRHGVRWGVVAD